LTCYRGTACNISGGAYNSSPNTAFFNVSSKEQSSITCWRANGCSSEATTSSSTTYFNKIVSYGSGITCYRATACNSSNGSYEHGSGTPSTTYFNTSQTSTLTGKTCDYATSCRYLAGSDSRLCLFSGTTEDTKKIPTGSNITCTNSSGCSAASKNIPTGYFTTASVNNGGATCNYATGAVSGYHIANSAQSSNYFNYDQASTDAYGTGCATKWSYKASSCKNTTDSGPHCIFNVTNSSADGVGPCYYSTDCVWVAPNTSYFKTASATVGGKTCSYATAPASGRCDVASNAVDSTYFKVSSTSVYATNKGTKGCTEMYSTRITGCTQNPDTTYCTTSSKDRPSSMSSCSAVTSCSIETGCKSEYASCDTEYFNTPSTTTCAGSTCYKSATPKTGGCYRSTNTYKTDYYNWSEKTCGTSSVYYASCKLYTSTSSDTPSAFVVEKDTDCRDCYKTATCANGWSESDSGMVKSIEAKMEFLRDNVVLMTRSCYQESCNDECPTYYSRPKPSACNEKFDNGQDKCDVKQSQCNNDCWCKYRIAPSGDSPSTHTENAFSGDTFWYYGSVGVGCGQTVMKWKSMKCPSGVIYGSDEQLGGCNAHSLDADQQPIADKFGWGGYRYTYVCCQEFFNMAIDVVPDANDSNIQISHNHLSPTQIKVQCAVDKAVSNTVKVTVQCDDYNQNANCITNTRGTWTDGAETVSCQTSNPTYTVVHEFYNLPSDTCYDYIGKCHIYEVSCGSNSITKAGLLDCGDGKKYNVTGDW